MKTYQYKKYYINPKNKTTRKEKNINIEPEKEMHKIPSHTIYSA